MKDTPLMSKLQSISNHRYIAGCPVKRKRTGLFKFVVQAARRVERHDQIRLIGAGQPRVENTHDVGVALKPLACGDLTVETAGDLGAMDAL